MRFAITSMLRLFGSSNAFRLMLAIFALAILAPTQSQAQVEYTKVCSLYGAGFLYLPGTDTCLNASQMVTNDFALARAQSLDTTGIAMAASLVQPFLPGGTNYAVSVHWGGFGGMNAVGVGGLMRLSGNLILSAGFAAGLDYGSVTASEQRTQTAYGTAIPTESWSQVDMMARAGFMYAW